MVLTVKDDTKTVEDILHELPHVEDAFESRIWHSYASPYAWGIDRIDQRSLPLDGTYENQWTGSGVSIYIVDSGIDLSHDQFNNTDERETANIFNYYGSLAENTDGDGHGTHCAGSAAGKSVGVAPQANLYGVKVLSDEGYGSDVGILIGLEAVYEHLTNSSGRGVVSMSLGGPCTSYRCEDDHMEAYDQIFQNLTEAGAVVSVAAGNEATDACFTFPSALESTIAVGAMDVTDVEAYFSNFGPCVQIYAPGVDILSACSSGTSNCTSESEYVEFSGTSMACPHMTGAFATYLQAEPDISYDALINRTVCGATQETLSLNTHWLYLESVQTPNRLLYTNFSINESATCDVDYWTSLTCPNGTYPYTFSLFDSYGDGWDSGYYYLHSFENPSNYSIYGSLGETPYSEQSLCVMPDSSYLMLVTGSDYPEELGWYGCSNLGGQTTVEHAPILSFGGVNGDDDSSMMITECSASCLGNVSTTVNFTGGAWQWGSFMAALYDGNITYLSNPVWEDAGALLCPESNTPCFELGFVGSFTTEQYETECATGYASVGSDSFCLDSNGACAASTDDATPTDDATSNDDGGEEEEEDDDHHTIDVAGVVIGALISVTALAGACFIGYRNWYSPRTAARFSTEGDMASLVSDK
jgi:hypothetical protein